MYIHADVYIHIFFSFCFFFTYEERCIEAMEVDGEFFSKLKTTVDVIRKSTDDFCDCHRVKLLNKCVYFYLLDIGCSSNSITVGFLRSSRQ